MKTIQKIMRNRKNQTISTSTRILIDDIRIAYLFFSVSRDRIVK